MCLVVQAKRQFNGIAGIAVYKYAILKRSCAFLSSLPSYQDRLAHSLGAQTQIPNNLLYEASSKETTFQPKENAQYIHNKYKYIVSEHMY